jgi:hypothetical protein
VLAVEPNGAVEFFWQFFRVYGCSEQPGILLVSQVFLAYRRRLAGKPTLCDLGSALEFGSPVDTGHMVSRRLLYSQKTLTIGMTCEENTHHTIWAILLQDSLGQNAPMQLFLEF